MSASSSSVTYKPIIPWFILLGSVRLYQASYKARNLIVKYFSSPDNSMSIQELEAVRSILSSSISITDAESDELDRLFTKFILSITEAQIVNAMTIVPQHIMRDLVPPEQKAKDNPPNIQQFMSGFDLKELYTQIKLATGTTDVGAVHKYNVMTEIFYAFAFRSAIYAKLLRDAGVTSIGPLLTPQKL